jgi:hypothetical protein
MKKVYETPSVDVVKFEYKDQVVAASGISCTEIYTHTGATETAGCSSPSTPGSQNQM